MNAYIYDTETTGVDPSKDKIIQDAFLSVSFEGGELIRDPMPPSLELWGSSVPISYGAMAVHKISEAAIAGMPEWVGFQGSETEGFMIGHKVDFDWAMAGKPDVRRICTLAIARNVYPDASSHSLGAIHLMQQNGSAEAIADLANAHDAGADVVLCFRILRHMLQTFRRDILTMEELWKWSERCRVPVRWDFGKFKGKPIGAADRGYMTWYLKQADTCPYYVAAIKEYLQIR